MMINEDFLNKLADAEPNRPVAGILTALGIDLDSVTQSQVVSLQISCQMLTGIVGQMLKGEASRREILNAVNELVDPQYGVFPTELIDEVIEDRGLNFLESEQPHEQH